MDENKENDIENISKENIEKNIQNTSDEKKILKDDSVNEIDKKENLGTNTIDTKKTRDKKKQKKSRKKITILIVIITFLFIFSIIFSVININNNKILGNITVMGIDIGNMKIEEAKETLSKIVDKKLEEEIVLKKDDYETSINSSQINAKFSIDETVEKAYSIGRDGNIITNNYTILYTILFGRNIDFNLEYSDENLNKKIEDISSKLPGSMIDNSYYIEDEKLIIVKGKEGLSVKEDELKQEIINEIKNIQGSNIITIPTENTKPGEIDIEKIRNEIYKEPEDAYVSQNPTTVHTHVNGVDLGVSLEEAKEILKQNKEEYTIPLKIIVPEKTISDLGEEAFPDKLASYSTRYDPTNKNRSNNISLATEKIDGTIIMPGEVFSYNKIVGERTIAAGYKEAGAYAGGKVVQDVGGGICQTSSTLYNAALLANLEIVDRSNHQFLTSYVDAGRDATVNWGSIDFQFKNSRTYPIRIEATSKNGVCLMNIYGIKVETEYEVIIQSAVKSYIPYSIKYENDSSLEEGREVVEQSGYTGCTSETYRILKLNGEVISKTLLSKDTYDPMTRIIRRGTKVNTETNNVE